MMKKIVLIISSIIAAMSFMAVPVYADDACSQYTGPNKELVCGSHNEADAEHKVGSIINAIFGIVGIIAVIVIIIGGVFYATSQGDPGKTKRARDAILYAVIGLLVVLLSFAIVNFILGAINK